MVALMRRSVAALCKQPYPATLPLRDPKRVPFYSRDALRPPFFFRSRIH